MTAPDIPSRLVETLQKITSAAAASGRSAEDVRLIAVSKLHPAAAVAAALRAGQKFFGENYVQEAKQKSDELRRTESLLFESMELHLIGHLQRNKAKDAVQVFDVIQTVDRESLAEAVESAAIKIGKRQKILLQVKVSPEESKSGVAPEGAGNLLKHCLRSNALEVLGLMCIGRFAPGGVSEEERRGEFGLLSNLRVALEDETSARLPHLSMGMSEDYVLAVGCGATMVRVGTAIFGSRG